MEKKVTRRRIPLCFRCRKPCTELILGTPLGGCLVESVSIPYCGSLACKEAAEKKKKELNLGPFMDPRG